MKHINGFMIGIRGGDARYAVMKKTVFGPIDVNSYHDSYNDAADEIYKIDREEVGE